MSYDYIIYLKQPIDRFSREDCEAYLRARGLDAHIPPDFDPLHHSGLLELGPIIASEGAKKNRLSGFEYDIDKHEYWPFTRKRTLWERLRGIMPEPEPDPFPHAVQDVFLSCHWLSEDVYAIPLALGFAGYLVLTCDGILYDPQKDETFSDLPSIDQELRLALADSAGAC